MKMLQAMINSDLYIGKVRENENFCEPYFDKEYMEKVRSLNCVKVTPSGLSYLYSGMIKCPLCGKKLAANKHTKSGKHYIYYRCPSGIKGIHKHFAIKEEYLEETISANIGLYLDAYVSKISTISQTEKKKKVRDIEELESTMKRIDHLFELGRIDIDEYDKKISALQKEIDSLSDEIAERKIVAKNVIFDNWKEMYDELTRKNQMLFWQGIVNEIEVDSNGDIVGVKFI